MPDMFISSAHYTAVEELVKKMVQQMSFIMNRVVEQDQLIERQAVALNNFGDIVAEHCTRVESIGSGYLLTGRIGEWYAMHKRLLAQQKVVEAQKKMEGGEVK